MKQILCEACGQEHKLIAGERLALEASDEEPAEYERIVWGKATQPDPAGRVMYVNDVAFPLPLNEYICDLCSASIKPGDRCCAQSVWLDGQDPVEVWEQEFITEEG
jgi:hypothetical protein